MMLYRCGIMVAIAAASAAAQVTERVSVSSTSGQGNADSAFCSITPDGRYVAFASGASNFVPNDLDGLLDIFVRDRHTGTMERCSVSSTGAQGDASSFGPVITPDARYVAFYTRSSNLSQGPGVYFDVFVRDRVAGTTEIVSISTAGIPGHGDSMAPSISADGRFVVFASDAFDLVPGDTNGLADIFVRDRTMGTTERISVDSAGSQGSGGLGCFASSVSADGRFVAFESHFSNLVSGDANAQSDVFVRDRLSATTERVSVPNAGGDSDSASNTPYISADGRFVSFQSVATNLVAGDSNGSGDIFVRDRQLAVTELVSVSTGGNQANQGIGVNGTLSGDGRFVTFSSRSTNLVPNDTNNDHDVFLHDRQTGSTERVSVNTAGRQANAFSIYSAVSADGRFVAFESDATNLVPGDSNGVPDIFVRDRDYSAFTPTCEPGVNGVIACPCSNPPAGLGRGCDNSSSTGGATLSAAGIAYLSMDSLVFTTADEQPTALSIVLQGTAAITSGSTYGQGVRCVGGTLKRLFTKTAAAGAVTAPDLSAGDPTVSARSAEKGDVIQAGQSRGYLVYYRDATVLGGCPATSTFNATVNGEVTWSP